MSELSKPLKIFVIPSWYPSEAFPSTGIFFKEQAVLMAKQKPDWKVGISTWGSHDPKYWMLSGRPLDAFTKYYSRKKMRQYESLLGENCIELRYPAYTWTRKVKNGNIEGIIEANEQNLKRFIIHFGKPDVIHAQVAYPAGFIAARLGQEYKIPFVITEHMSPFPMPSLKSILKEKLIPTLKRANKVFAVSDHLVSELGKHKVTAQQISNFIDDDFFSPSERKHTNATFTFLAVGRLEKQKDYSTMFEAAAILSKSAPNFRLKIIGTGSYQRVLVKKVHQLQLEHHVEFLGECDRARVRDEMRLCDVFINSSIHENQPVAIMEALACDKPVVATNWKGADEMVGEEVGLLSDLQDATALTENMRLMMLKERNQEQIRHYFETRYGSKIAVEGLEEVYLEIVR
jgi:glycosyltransferase involved in cell wall biosynthesis